MLPFNVVQAAKFREHGTARAKDRALEATQPFQELGNVPGNVEKEGAALLALSL